MKKFLLLLFPLSLILKYVSSINPSFIERFYSGKLYKYIILILTTISKLIPFSIAEIMVIILSITVIFYIISSIIKILKKDIQRKLIFKNIVMNISAAFAVIYFLFNILWGFNYYRYSYSRISGLNNYEVNYKNLENLCTELINSTNDARKYVLEDPNGVMKLSHGKDYILTNAYKGFENISAGDSILTGNYGRAKGIEFSHPMSYTGITGFYFPFTGEANVNLLTPDSLFPATVCHELSHQRGFAREDESNFIAYLASINNSEGDFKYSGNLLALINVLNALKQHDNNAYKKILSSINPGVKRDINYLNIFWNKYEGIVTKVSDKINDLYLKSNNQTYGIESYGRMVDLLILEYNKRASVKGS